MMIDYLPLIQTVLTGNVPGIPASNGATLVLGLSEVDVGAGENNLRGEDSLEWISNPITGLHPFPDKLDK
jgi:hypothetical protein